MKQKGTKAIALGAFLFLAAEASLISIELEPSDPGIAFSAKRDGYPTIFLAGAIHALPEDHQIPPSIYITIYHLVNRIGFEYDENEGGSSDRVQKSFFPAQEKSASALLAPISLTQLRTFCDQDDLFPFNQALFASPLYVHFQVLQTLNSRSGISPKFGTDTVFRAAAESDSKPLLFLETASDQISAFEKLGVPYFESRIVDRVSKNPDSHRAQADHLYSLWRDGDTSGFESASVAEMSDEFSSHILEDRNRAWLPKILSQAKADDSPIVYFVGSAHLVGKQSLIELLEREGFAVTQIRSSASLPSPEAPAPRRPASSTGPPQETPTSKAKPTRSSQHDTKKSFPNLFRKFRSKL
ncbi:MAG: TraB/GumN family protein [Verrucomicrobiae bacterium]|nr:TraB/GumN family protein [Verrucomicrobiae bacterium]